MATPQTQMSPDQQAASAAAVRMLREIVDYQRRSASADRCTNRAANRVT